MFVPVTHLPVVPVFLRPRNHNLEFYFWKSGNLLLHIHSFPADDIPVWKLDIFYFHKLRLLSWLLQMLGNPVVKATLYIDQLRQLSNLIHYCFISFKQRALFFIIWLHLFDWMTMMIYIFFGWRLIFQPKIIFASSEKFAQIFTLKQLLLERGHCIPAASDGRLWSKGRMRCGWLTQRSSTN